MKRYIDADELIDYFYCAGARLVYQDLVPLIIERINLVPTADVVPRAEVERMVDEGEYWQGKYLAAKSEVAREIFADLEQYGICEQLYMGGVCLTEQEFEELKKKYGVE